MVHVLVIDDEKGWLNTLQMILESRGFEVTCVDNGADGIMLLQSYPNRYDLVLLDFMMPQMNGTEVLVRMKQHATQIPVILQSGITMGAQIEEARSLGIAAEVSKPFGRKELMPVLEQVLFPLGKVPLAST